MARVQILGASGSGTTTLGTALAHRLGHPHVDADSLFWLPTDPPFTTKRPRGKRQAMLLRLLPVAGQWVFSGSVPEWAKPIEPSYDLVVFLWLDPAVRRERRRPTAPTPMSSSPGWARPCAWSGCASAKRPATASHATRAVTRPAPAPNFSDGRRPTIPPLSISGA